MTHAAPGQFTKGAWWPTGRTVGGTAELCITTGFRFYVGAVGSPWYVDVEDGFTFNGCSMPWWARWAFDMGGLEVPSAVHDRLRRASWCPLWLGNLIFLHAMFVYGTKRWQAVVACAGTFASTRRD